MASSAPLLSPYPWAQLERTGKAEVAATVRARRLLAGAIDVQQLAYAASELAKIPVEISLRGASLSEWLPMPSGVRLHLTAEAAGADVTLDLEPSLAVRLAAAVVGEPLSWIDPSKAPPPEIVGAVSAFVVALARRAGDGVPWRLSASARAEATVHLVARAVVMIGSDIHEATVAVPVAGRIPAPPTFDRASLFAMGDLPLSLSVVAASTLVRRSDLDALGTGDAFLPGRAWMIRAQGNQLTGEVWLVAPRGETGLRASLPLGASQDVVLTPGTAQASWDRDDMNNDTIETPADPGPDALGDVDVVVRVEVATVTLPARSWAALAPGDVVASGVRLGEPVVLRAGGVVIARGELCVLDGELAVRVIEKKGGG